MLQFVVTSLQLDSNTQFRLIAFDGNVYFIGALKNGANCRWSGA